MMRYKEEKEAKKESFRKYLESTGVVDSLTKVLVALYEQNEKPASAIEFIQEKLGGPSLSDYEKLQAEMTDLRIKYDELLAVYKETCKEVVHLDSSSLCSVLRLEELKNSKNVASTVETSENGVAPKDES